MAAALVRAIAPAAHRRVHLRGRIARSDRPALVRFPLRSTAGADGAVAEKSDEEDTAEEEPEAEAEVATAGAAKRATAAARSKLNDGHDVGMDGIKASLSALMTGMNALSRGVDMRMDRIEATLQAQERRLRKIEAAVTKN